MMSPRILDHPLIQSKLTQLRNRNTEKRQFRSLLKELTALMVYEITRDFPPSDPARWKLLLRRPRESNRHRLSCWFPYCVPVLACSTAYSNSYHGRESDISASIGIPNRSQPVIYYSKLPPGLSESRVIVVDPMLATGGSAITGIQSVKDAGGSTIKFLCLVAAPEGIKALGDAHPEIPIYIPRPLTGNSTIMRIYFPDSGMRVTAYSEHREKRPALTKPAVFLSHADQVFFYGSEVKEIRPIHHPAQKRSFLIGHFLRMPEYRLNNVKRKIIFRCYGCSKKRMPKHLSPADSAPLLHLSMNTPAIFPHHEDLQLR